MRKHRAFMNINYQETKYGFDWGAAKITRTASLPDNSVIVCVETTKEILEVRITKSGFIRNTHHKKGKKK